MISGIGLVIFRFLNELDEVSCRFILMLETLVTLLSSIFLEWQAVVMSASGFWLTFNTSGAEENDSDLSYTTFRRECLLGMSSLFAWDDWPTFCDELAALVFLLGVMQGGVPEGVWCNVLCDLSTKGCGLWARPTPKWPSAFALLLADRRFWRE